MFGVQSFENVNQLGIALRFKQVSTPNLNRISIVLPLVQTFYTLYKLKGWYFCGPIGDGTRGLF